ncbi:putative mitochondrial chaperone BCS1-B [Achaetomium macrosporum]|uniref:Mitochondrial chaperone BCS1-B n=1 Tax=Achaetomium macrosporum TaxID=79813 RepID=A0AAN7CHJ7_9PEZI|nr:putative mitochondrial chaperone BCS1-B [Achaetomium macrosporum]
MEAVPPLPSGDGPPTGAPQNALLDFFFPGFGTFALAVNKYLHIDLNVYIPLVLLFSGLTFAWRYFSEYFSGLVESHLMSVVDIRPDDEIYNMLMAWVANQRFSQGARRFVVNTNLNSRSWYLWRWDDDEETEEDDPSVDARKKKSLAYTPTFGSHWFLYKGRILIFRRTQNTQQSAFLTVSEREEISISCFGRNPWILKELLYEAREEYMRRDEAKTLIYRGTTRSGSSEPQWQRCMARTSRPFSTVILNEKVKKELIDDVTDYLNPATRRWYSNRGIPYRRGYLLYGPPGTGKSSLSLALAGFFKMRIYIVSLSSVTANEENLATLFAELPRRCVVLLEDIDTAGLTHTREHGSQGGDNGNDNDNDNETTNTNTARNPRLPAGANPNPNPNNTSGRLSLSGLLNILDGVASQEGRVLIMTTNHLEKLDKALIRPGRVDMIVKFDRADTEMISALFKAIYAPLEGDDAPSPSAAPASSSRALFQLENTLKTAAPNLTPEEQKQKEAEAAEAARKREETVAKVNVLAEQFAAKIPAHEFSPAEIQGFLLKNKRDPEKAIEGAEQWVINTRKEKKERELKEAEEKRKQEEEEKKKEEEEKKKKKEEEEKEAKKGKKNKRGKKDTRKSKKSSSSKKNKAGSDTDDDSGSSSSSEDAESDSESEREKEKEKEKETKKKSKPAAATALTPAADTAAPAELKQADASEAKTEPVVIVPTITIDTDKAKEAALEVQKMTPGADSGYGTP